MHEFKWFPFDKIKKKRTNDAIYVLRITCHVTQLFVSFKIESKLNE